jgi:hypothetical protein
MLKIHQISGPEYDHTQLYWLSVPLSAIQNVTAVTASGPELVQCCYILGRRRPNSDTYVFVGDNAREIVLNWQTQTENTSKHTKT